MEEDIQRVLSAIWDFVEDNDDVLLIKLYKISFENAIQKETLVFLISRLLHSEGNLLKFLDTKAGFMNPKHLAFRCKILDFLCELIETYPTYIVDYIEYIRKMNIGIFSAEKSHKIQEKVLNFTAKILEIFPLDIIEKIYEPKKYIEILLTDIRINKLTTTIKGCTWEIIGILLKNYPILLEGYRNDVHQLMYDAFAQLVCAKKLEHKALQGVLRAFLYTLYDPRLSPQQIEKLYKLLKSLTTPLPDANVVKINVLALETISEHGRVFSRELRGDSTELFKHLLNLCKQTNQELRSASNEAIEKISLNISNSLLEDSTLHKETFKLILSQIEEVLSNKYESGILLGTAISLVGIFAGGIVRFMGENMLIKYMEELIVLCEKDIISNFSVDSFNVAKMINYNKDNADYSDPSSRYKPSKSIKVILSKQKQYISILNSYSNIIQTLSSSSLGELIVSHLTKALSISFSTHSQFYVNYKPRLVEASARVVEAMSKHRNFFWFFIRRISRKGILESIRSNENIVFDEKGEKEKIKNCVHFWVSFLGSDQVFSEFTQRTVFDEMFGELVSILVEVDLYYEEKKGDDMGNNRVYYEARNAADLENFNKICEFLNCFLNNICQDKNIGDSEYLFRNTNNNKNKYKNNDKSSENISTSNLRNLFNNWIPLILRRYIYISNTYPRLGSSYIVLTTIFKYCSLISFFSKIDNNSLINDIYIYTIRLIKRVDSFEDQLLLSSIEALLSLPKEIIKYVFFDRKKKNIKNLKFLYKKGFELGFTYIKFADLTIEAIEDLFCNKQEEEYYGYGEYDIYGNYTVIDNKKKDDDICDNKNIKNNVKYNIKKENYEDDICTSIVSKNKENDIINNNNKNTYDIEIMNEVMPIFGEYLLEYEKKKKYISTSISVDPNLEHSLEEYSKIQYKILDILGSLGGPCHSLIKDSPQNISLGLINVTSPRRILFRLPLHNKKYPIYLDDLFLRLIDLLSPSISKSRLPACELLHALVVFVVGGENKASQGTIVFLLRSVLNLSVDREKPISRLFASLLKQLVHWAAKRGTLRGDSEVLQMLDLLVEASSETREAQIREAASEAIGEYVRWFVKQHSGSSVREKAHTVKYLVRKIESNAVHPEPFRRLGSAVNFSKILDTMNMCATLADKFLLEILFYLFGLIRGCSGGEELDEQIFKNCINSVNKVLEGLLRGGINGTLGLLMEHNERRNVFMSIEEVLNFLYNNLLLEEGETSSAYQQFYYSLFRVLNMSHGKEEKLKDYWDKENKWPNIENIENNDIDQQNIIDDKEFKFGDKNNNDNDKKINDIAKYQFLLFLIEKNIISISELGTHYKRAIPKNLIIELGKIIDNMYDIIKKNSKSLDVPSDMIYLKKNFIYIVNIIYRIDNIKDFSNDMKLLYIKNNDINDNPIEEKEKMEIEDIENELYFDDKEKICKLFTILHKLKETEHKIFISKHYVNELTEMINSSNKLIQSIISSIPDGDISFFSIIETYLSQKCPLFHMISEPNNQKTHTQNTQSFLEKAPISNPISTLIKTLNNKRLTDFVFSIVIDRRICNFFTDNFTNIIKNNLEYVVDHPAPNLIYIQKMYMKYLFFKNFETCAELLVRNQFYFDTLADDFLMNLFGDNKIKDNENLKDIKEYYNDDNYRKEQIKNYIESEYFTQFISNLCRNPSLINVVFILFERASITQNTIITQKITSIFTENIVPFDAQDALVSQIKIMTMIYANNQSNNLSNDNTISFESGISLAERLLALSSTNINIIKELLNLLGVLAKSISDSEYSSVNKASNTQSTVYSIYSPRLRSCYRHIQSRYFPVTTRVLLSNSREYAEFELVFGCLLRTFSSVRSFAFLELLFPVLREDGTRHCLKARDSIDQYLDRVIDEDEDAGVSEAQRAVEVFLRKDEDINVRDNIRFSIMKSVVFRYVKRLFKRRPDKLAATVCSLFTRNYEKMLKEINEIAEKTIWDANVTDPVKIQEKVLMIEQNTRIFQFFSLIFNYINETDFKVKVHKSLKGIDSKGNEITKELIPILHRAKSKEIPGLEHVIEKLSLSEYENEDRETFIKKTENAFYCSAYNCLCSLLLLTQNKENVFQTFLLKTNRDKGEKLFDLLISDHYIYNFPIETNFYTKNIDNEYNGNVNNNANKDNSNISNNGIILYSYQNTFNMIENIDTKNIVNVKNTNTTNNIDNNNSNIKKKLLIDSLVSDSFFHDAYGATLKSSLDQAQANIDTSFLEGFKSGLNISFVQGQTQDNQNITNQNLLEEDPVNKHPVMRSMLRVLTFLHKNFANLSNEKENRVPGHVQLILNEINRISLRTNQKIFLIKLIINKREVFEKYMNLFLPALISFSVSDETCGKGLNYFLRDIASTILLCPNLRMPKNKENIIMLSQYVNRLIKLAGHERNIIFRTNLRLINDLMSKFKDILYLDKATILKMLRFDEKQPQQHIWKITAVQALASAFEYDIPLDDDLIYNNMFGTVDNKNLFVKSIERDENFITAVVKLCDNHRTPVQNAAIEFLSKIIQFYDAKFRYSPNKDELLSKIFFYSKVNRYLLSLSCSSVEKLSVNCIFRSSIHFPRFLRNRTIFNFALTMFKTASYKNKNLILIALCNFLVELVNDEQNVKKNNVNNDMYDNFLLLERAFLDDIYYTLYQIRDALFISIDDEILMNLINLMNQFLLRWDNKYSEGFSLIINNIQKSLKGRETAIKSAYFNFLVDTYNRLSINEVSKNLLPNIDINSNKDMINDLPSLVLNKILINFKAEKEPELLRIFIGFLNANPFNLVPSDPVQRLIFILKALDNETITDTEGGLIQIMLRPLLTLAYSSDDFNILIYEKGLENCVFRDLNLGMSGCYLNRSQPVGPSAIMRNTMDETFENLVNTSLANFNSIQKSNNTNNNDNNVNNSNYGMMGTQVGMLNATIAGNSNLNLTNTLNNVLNSSFSDMMLYNSIMNYSDKQLDTIPENIGSTNNNTNNNLSMISNLKNTNTQTNPNLNQFTLAVPTIGSTYNFGTINNNSNATSKATSKCQDNIQNLSSSQSEINLAQHSSLVGNSVNYPSMSPYSSKTVTFGYTHNEAFKAPLPPTVYGNSRNKIYNGRAKISHLLSENDATYTPIEVTSSLNHIRFLPDGADRFGGKSKNDNFININSINNNNKNSSQNNQKSCYVSEKLLFKWLGREGARIKKQPRLMRRYRIGDLPDIQIKNRDLIEPLITVVLDSEDMASELLIKLIRELYIESVIRGLNKEIEDQFERIAKINSRGNHRTENVIFRIILEFMKENQEYIPKIGEIRDSGIGTRNFHAGIMIFEESIRNLKRGGVLKSENDIKLLKGDKNKDNKKSKSIENTIKSEKQTQKSQKSRVDQSYIASNIEMSSENSVVDSDSKELRSFTNASVQPNSNDISNNDESVTSLTGHNNNSEPDNDGLSQSDTPNALDCDIYITKPSSRVWLYILEFYSKLHTKDIQIGLIQNFALKPAYVLAKNSDFLYRLSCLLSEYGNNIKRNIQRSNLLQAAFGIIPETGDEKDRDKIDELRARYSTKIFNDKNNLCNIIEDYTIESCRDLGNWDKLGEFLGKKYKENIKDKKNYEGYMKNLINEKDFLDRQEEYMESLILSDGNGYSEEDKMMCDEFFNDIINKNKEKIADINVIKQNPNKNMNPNDPSSSYINTVSTTKPNTNIQTNKIYNSEKLPYLIALYFVKKLDFDRAFLYYLKAKQKFCESWHNLGEYAGSDLRHESLKNIQLLYELGEFLKIVRGTGATNKNLVCGNSKITDEAGKENDLNAITEQLNELENNDKKSKKKKNEKNNLILSEYGINSLHTLLNKWSCRWPNSRYDNASAFEFLTGVRKVYINTLNKSFKISFDSTKNVAKNISNTISNSILNSYSNTIDNFDNIKNENLDKINNEKTNTTTDNIINFSSYITNTPFLRDFNIVQYVRGAQGLLKRGLIDLADRELRLALASRMEKEKNNNIVVVPFLMCKFKILKIETIKKIREIIGDMGEIKMKNNIGIDNKVINEMNYNLKIENDEMIKIGDIDDINDLSERKIIEKLDEIVEIEDKYAKFIKITNKQLELKKINENTRLRLNLIKTKALLSKSSIYCTCPYMTGEKGNEKIMHNNTIDYNNKLIDSFKEAKDNFYKNEETIVNNSNNNIDNLTNILKSGKSGFYLKLIRPMIKYCDTVIRKYQFEEGNRGDDMKSFYNEIVKLYIEYIMKGLIFGDNKIGNKLPKILDILSKENNNNNMEIENDDNISNIFKKYSSRVNIKYFLLWKNQILSYIHNDNISNLLKPIIEKILIKYPQSLFYAFNTIHKYSSIFYSNDNNNYNSLNIKNLSDENTTDSQNINDNINISNRTSLYQYLHNFYSHFSNLHAFIEALESLINPEHKVKYWIAHIKKIFTNAVKCKENKDIAIRKIEEIISELKYDVLENNKKYIKEKVGTYNRKFGESFGKIIMEINIQKIKDILYEQNTETEKLEKIMMFTKPIINAMEKSDNIESDGIEKLSTFSEYLSQYECTDLTDPTKYIVLPSSVSKDDYYNDSNNYNLNDNNILNTNFTPSIKVSSFDQHIFILASIRKPKRLRLFCNDEKAYDFLVKGCEDLRLDQRIQELFGVMNSILEKKTENCGKIKIGTFGVVPVNKKLGLIEWIKDTQPMYKVIKFSMDHLFKNNREKGDTLLGNNEKDNVVDIDDNSSNNDKSSNIDDGNSKTPYGWELQESAQYVERYTWYNRLFPKLASFQLKSFAALHIEKPQDIIAPFRLVEDMMPADALQRALGHFLLTPEEILSTRHFFMRNYCALCICHYILGIGDRHLDNFLIDIRTAGVVGIDFGVAFGQGSNQFIPELVPFRMTRQIVNVGGPFSLRGIVRETMIDVLRSLKSGKDLILDYCEVFVKEPLLDWVEAVNRENEKIDDNIKDNDNIDMNIIKDNTNIGTNSNITLTSNNESTINNQNTNNSKLLNPLTSPNKTHTKNNNQPSESMALRKLSIVHQKLSSYNPIKISKAELSENVKIKGHLRDTLFNALSGSRFSLRTRLRSRVFLDDEVFVDVLNEQATDPNLLGRMWIGWSPFV